MIQDGIIQDMDMALKKNSATFGEQSPNVSLFPDQVYLIPALGI
jgi:hypothetical protein